MENVGNKGKKTAKSRLHETFADGLCCFQMDQVISFFKKIYGAASVEIGKEYLKTGSLYNAIQGI